MKEPLTAEQSELAAKYVPLAMKIAKRRVNSILPPEDREQEACLGLMDAARLYDASLGLKFITYAHHKIIGAILDAERRTDTALLKISRGDRKKGVPEIKVSMADSTGADVKTVNGVSVLVPLSRIAFVTPAPAFSCIDRDAIESALTAASDDEWYIAERHFLGGATMKQAGLELGLSESRVSQLASRLLDRLRDHTALRHYAKGA